MPPIISKKKCVACHRCVEICPVDVYGLTQADGQIPLIRYPEECWHCNACVFDCPSQAITLRVPVPAMMVFVDAPAKGAGSLDKKKEIPKNV